MKGWIGVDLDGTLARTDYVWRGHDTIGEPIAPMVARVKQWLAEGKDVRIMTARAYEGGPAAKTAIRKWCQRHLGQVLPITCTKDYEMLELWDDRAVRVVVNQGEPCCGGAR